MHSLFPGSTNNHFCCMYDLPFCLSSGWWSNKQFSVHTQLFSHKTVLHISELLLLVPRSCKGASTPGLTNARPAHHWDRYTLDTCFFSWIMILEIRLPYPGEDKKGSERCPLISSRLISFCRVVQLSCRRNKKQYKKWMTFASLPIWLNLSHDFL